MDRDDRAKPELPSAPRRATSTDVARAAGVSRATVSYVLNGKTDRGISEATWEHVLQTADRLGHVPHAPARALRSGHSDLVLVIVQSYSEGYLTAKLFEALDAALAERNYGLFLHHSAGDGHQIRRLWSLMAPTLVVATEGVAPRDKEIIANAGVPFIDLEGVISHLQIGRTQAELVISRGYARLGFAYPEDRSLEAFASQRLAGVTQACRAAGLPDPIVRMVSFSPQSAQAAIQNWLAAGVDAVCAHNDDIGITLLGAVRTLGLQAPQDIAIIGIDNIPMAEIGLTTIAIDIDSIAEAVVHRVLSALDGHPQREVVHDYLRPVLRTSL